MDIQNISEDGYSVQYNPTAAELTMSGELALRGPAEYAPINDLLMTAIATQPEVITLNLQELMFLNSSGISMISKFVLQLRSQQETQLIVKGSNSIPWQKKSLKNLQKFLPGLKLEM